MNTTTTTTSLDEATMALNAPACEDAVWSLAPYDLREIARNGYGSMRARVSGYWSQDVITVYLRATHQLRRDAEGNVMRDDDGNAAFDVQWKIQMSHSSGGRDTNEVEHDEDAETNFAHALRGIAAIVREIRTQHVPMMSVAFFEEQAARRAAEKQRDAERQAAIDADPALGAERAKALTMLAMATAADDGDCDVVVFARAEADPIRLRAHRDRRTDRVRWVNPATDRPTSRADVIERLTNSSKRTHIATAAKEGV